MSQRHTAAAHPQLLAAAATGVEGFIRSYRLCPDRLFGQAGIDAGALGSPMARLDLGGYCTLMELGAAQSGDPCFGLGYGQKFTPEMLGLIGYVAISSPDLMTAAANLARYFRHHQQGTVTELAFAEPFCTLSYRIDPARVARRRQDALVTLGMFCNVFRHAAGPEWCPDAVELEEEDRGDRAAIEAAFGAPVRFGRPTNALLFRPERARHAMPQADAMLNSLLCANLVGLGMGEATPDLRAQVQAEMRANLATPDLDLEQIGEKLGMTRWTLQRRLAEEGTSFAQLLDELRRELACRWLLDRSLQIGTVSERLGYSEPSAFVRAFRRWQQVSPSDYRRAALAPRH